MANNFWAKDLKETKGAFIGGGIFTGGFTVFYLLDGMFCGCVGNSVRKDGKEMCNYTKIKLTLSVDYKGEV